MKCSHCNETLPDSARFCHGCGMSLGRDQVTQTHDPSTHSDLRETAQARINTVEAKDPLIGRVLESKYEVIGRLGEGGMGTVYRARRTRIGDEVAVKVLHQSYVRDEAALARFRREAQAAAMLNHPNVVTIHDYGEASADTAPAFIVMELVKGRSLRDILESERRLSPARAVALMRSICAGVGAAHRNNIIHRDIKPDNIIVLPPHSEGEQESVKVLDFGIAKLRDASPDHSITRTGIVIGTPYYMSPEQCRALQLDSRSDVYSLGAMLYEMLAGIPPFDAATATGIVAKHLTEPPPPLPPELGVQPTLEEVIMRSLAKDARHRQADASVFARELQAALAGSPVPQSFQNAKLPPPTRQGSASELLSQAETRQYEFSPQPVSQDYSGQINYQSSSQPVTAKSSSRAVLIAGASVAFVIVIGLAAGLWFWNQNNIAQTNANTSFASPNTAQPANSNASIAIDNTPPVAVSPPVTPPPVASVNRNSAPPPQIEQDSGDRPSSGIASKDRAEAKILSGGLLSSRDLEGISQLELRLLRNTIYARHGRIFDRPEMRRYFSRRPWYTPRPGYRDSDLTRIDQANIRMILAAERSR